MVIMADVYYPSAEKIIEFNVLALTIIRAKRADKAQVLSRVKIEKIISDCQAEGADIYDKAVILLKGIIQSHPFASGNRRTALISTKDFLIKNRHDFAFKDEEDYTTVFQGIRERHYTDKEIKEWITHGKIRGFQR